MPYRPEHLQHFPTLAAMRPPRVTVAIAWMIAIGIALSAAIMVYVRAQEVSALVAGRIERWYVQDGQHVARGQPIARVVDVDPQLLSRLAAERAQVQAEIAAVRQGQAVASIDVGRARQLLAEGLVARRDLEQAQIKVADAAAKLAEARAKLNRIDVQLNRQAAQLVRAPRDGRIQTINAAAGGALISPGTMLAVVAPERVERAVALVRVGQQVRLEFEGWPAIQFSGWPSVAQGLFDGRVRGLDPTASPTGLFRVLVEPLPGKPAWPDPRFTRPGAKVRGWIQMETVSVGYELWRQLNDFPLEFGQGQGVAKAAATKDDDAAVLKAGKAK